MMSLFQINVLCETSALCCSNVSQFKSHRERNVGNQSHMDAIKPYEIRRECVRGRKHRGCKNIRFEAPKTIKYANCFSELFTGVLIEFI